MQLDTEFMKRAAKITSVNLTTSDFTSIRYKREIQSLYQQYIFKSLDQESLLSDLNIQQYNRLVRSLKNDDRVQFEKIHNMPLKNIGPGEVILFLLTKWPNGYLGGGSSGGVDFIFGSEKYEVKAVKWKNRSKKDYVSDFRLGGNITGMTQFEAELQRAFHAKGYTPSVGTSEIKWSLFQKFESEHPKEYEELEKKYKSLAMNYFSNNEVIFIQTESNQPDFGEIIAIKKVKPEDIKMERYTSRYIKPLIKV